MNETPVRKISAAFTVVERYGRENWTAVAELLAAMRDDDGLMLQWGLIEAGDVRSDRGRRALVEQKRAQMDGLVAVATQRAEGIS